MHNIISTLAAKVTLVGDGANTLSSDVKNIITAIIGVLGILAVVVIIIGGVTYMTSSGDAAKVKKAKDTILYGVIGLIVVALSFAIVNFVIDGILNQSSSSGSEQSTGDNTNKPTLQIPAPEVDPPTNPEDIDLKR